jgi:methenyltetrahydromethanopterin cyclohydrolase
MPPEAARPSLYRLTQPLLRQLIDDAAALRLRVETTAEGCTLVDAGIDCAGGIAAWVDWAVFNSAATARSAAGRGR